MKNIDWEYTFYCIAGAIITGILVFTTMGCAQFYVGKNCVYGYREIQGSLEKTELSVCEKP